MMPYSYMEKHTETSFLFLNNGITEVFSTPRLQFEEPPSLSWNKPDKITWYSATFLFSHWVWWVNWPSRVKSEKYTFNNSSAWISDKCQVYADSCSTVLIPMVPLCPLLAWGHLTWQEPAGSSGGGRPSSCRAEDTSQTHTGWSAGPSAAPWRSAPSSEAHGGCSEWEDTRSKHINKIWLSCCLFCSTFCVKKYPKCCNMNAKFPQCAC